MEDLEPGEYDVPPESLTLPAKRHRTFESVDDLIASIGELGILNPITVAPSREIIAGARRWTAARSLGLEVVPIHVIAAPAAIRELAEIDENLCRQELTALQRAEHLARRKVLYLTLHPEAAHGKRGKKDAPIASFPADAAVRTGRSVRSIQEDVRIADRLTEDLRAAIRGTEIADSKKQLMRLAEMDPARQNQVVSIVAEGKAKDVPAAIRVLNREEYFADLARKSEPLEDGTGRRYSVIYADPPWRYKANTTDPTRQIENHYPTMPLREILDLEVTEIALDDAILFLWGTAPLLPEALAVIRAWGFIYKTNMVWDKERMGMGKWTRVQHEHLLIAVRGAFKTPDPSRLARSVVRDERDEEHSRKPAAFAEMIDRLFPDLAKIELFRRGAARPGWEAWGNQAEPGGGTVREETARILKKQTEDAAARMAEAFPDGANQTETEGGDEVARGVDQGTGVDSDRSEAD